MWGGWSDKYTNTIFQEKMCRQVPIHSVCFRWKKFVTKKNQFLGLNKQNTTYHLNYTSKYTYLTFIKEYKSIYEVQVEMSADQIARREQFQKSCKLLFGSIKHWAVRPIEDHPCVVSVVFLVLVWQVRPEILQLATWCSLNITQ